MRSEYLHYLPLVDRPCTFAPCRCTLDLAALGGVEGYSGLLKRLLYEASRNRTKAVAGVAAAAFTAAVRAGQAAEDAEGESTWHGWGVGVGWRNVVGASSPQQCRLGRRLRTRRVG